jgi:cytochrome bd-type quinol oxidase subunit 2
MMNKLLLILHSIPLLIISAVIFTILNILDAHSTWLVIRPHHYGRERNPVARWVFKKLGLPRGIIIFKIAIFAILIPAGVYYATLEPLTLNIVLIVANIVFGLVVYNNYRIYRRMMRRVTNISEDN